MRQTQLQKWLVSSIALMSCWLLMEAQQTSETSQPETQPRQITSQALRFAKQVEQLNPNDVHDLYKIFVVLRCQDVPLAQRKELALRILTGAYPNKPDFRWIDSGKQAGLIEAALVALSHMHIDDPSVLPTLEEYLPKWERIARWEQTDLALREPLPDELKRLAERVSPNLTLLRAIIIRLKAVQAVPEVKSATDLERRLEVMLKEAKLSRSELKQGYEEFWEAIKQDKHITAKSRFVFYLVGEYGRMLFHYAKRGMDVRAAYQDLDITGLQGYARLGTTARDPAQLIDQLIQAQGDDRTTGQLLVDEGIRVVPLIIQRLETIKDDRSQISSTGMGVVVLLEVLATLAGESALPWIEPFTQDERVWLCHYARMAKEWVEQGKVYGFNSSL